MVHPNGMKYNLFEINERLQNGEITSEQAHKELLILFDVGKPFYCKTKRCHKTKSKQCDECALQELNDM